MITATLAATAATLADTERALARAVRDGHDLACVAQLLLASPCARDHREDLIARLLADGIATVDAVEWGAWDALSPGSLTLWSTATATVRVGDVVVADYEVCASYGVIDYVGYAAVQADHEGGRWVVLVDYVDLPAEPEVDVDDAGTGDYVVLAGPCDEVRHVTATVEDAIAAALGYARPGRHAGTVYWRSTRGAVTTLGDDYVYDDDVVTTVRDA